MDGELLGCAEVRRVGRAEAQPGVGRLSGGVGRTWKIRVRDRSDHALMLRFAFHPLHLAIHSLVPASPHDAR